MEYWEGIVDEYKYVYPSTDKYRMNIGGEDQKRKGTEEEEQKGRTEEKSII